MALVELVFNNQILMINDADVSSIAYPSNTEAVIKMHNGETYLLPHSEANKVWRFPATHHIPTINTIFTGSQTGELIDCQQPDGSNMEMLAVGSGLSFELKTAVIGGPGVTALLSNVYLRAWLSSNQLGSVQVSLFNVKTAAHEELMVLETTIPKDYYFTPDSDQLSDYSPAAAASQQVRFLGTLTGNVTIHIACLRWNGLVG